MRRSVLALLVIAMSMAACGVERATPTVATPVDEAQPDRRVAQLEAELSQLRSKVRVLEEDNEVLKAALEKVWPATTQATPTPVREEIAEGMTLDDVKRITGDPKPELLRESAEGSIYRLVDRVSGPIVISRNREDASVVVDGSLEMPPNALPLLPPTAIKATIIWRIAVKNGKVASAASEQFNVPYLTDDRTNPNDFGPSTKTSFFATERKDVDEMFAPLCEVPAGDAPLKTAEYRGVVLTFRYWMRRFMKPECVPSREFVLQNLRLWPATKECNEDRAFLAFDYKGRHFFIAQTGGTNQRFYLFVALDKSQQEGEVGKTEWFSRIVEEYIVDRQKEFTPKIVAKKVGSLWMLDTPYDAKNNESYLGTLKALSNGKEIAFSVEGMLPNEIGPPHIPQPNEWFKVDKADDSDP